MSKRPSRAAVRHVFHAPAPADSLPPHSVEEERATIGAVILAGQDGSQTEVDTLLARLRVSLFWTEECRTALAVLRDVRARGHAVDAITAASIGRLDPVWLGDVLGLVSSVSAFDLYLPHLQELAHRRWLLAKAAELRELASSDKVSLEDTRTRLAELHEATDKAGRGDAHIEVVTAVDVNAYQPDPETYLIGENVISRQSTTVICGWPGLGKSRLTTTLALAGARGRGKWMGYDVRRRFRTFVLQSENSVGRIKSELDGINPDLIQDFVRFSKPCALSFHKPEFRRALAQIWAGWQFDCLVIDPWTDVVRDAEAGDVAEAFDNLRASLPAGERCPAVVIVAHIRKQGRTDRWRPKAGSELMHEVLGSQSTVGKARTVFALQPADPSDATDDTVILDAGKCNDGRPNPASAWTRRNGEFLAVPDFDFDGWRNPPEDGVRKVINEQVMRDVLEGVFLTRKEAVAQIQKMGFSEPAAYRALSADGKFADLITVAKDGRLYIKTKE